jgi:GxxExxY protein
VIAGPNLAPTIGMTPQLNSLTEQIIGAAIRVHRSVGPGLLEKSYEAALGIELRNARLSFERQVHIPVYYLEEWIGDYRVDMVVAGEVLVEIKSVERVEPLFEAQMLAYLRASAKPIGLLINFNSHLLTQGVRRFVNSRV